MHKKSIPHPIPYQGSKRNIAKSILSFFPGKVKKLIEPFGGSAAISIASAYYNTATKFIINDLNEPLILLLKEIVENPQNISDNYRKIWMKQLGNERNYYDKIRNEFNINKQPENLLFLMARCVKGAIRYNTFGEFNQSPDNRRKGRLPENMEKDIYGVSNLLKNKVIFYSKDYRDLIYEIESDDLIYMDPPYQGVCIGRDQRYLSTVNIDEFTKFILSLNKKNSKFIISYDGKTGEKQYGTALPSELNLHHITIKVGRSTQATLNGSKDITFESLYLSEPLVSTLDKRIESYIDNSFSLRNDQLTLPFIKDNKPDEKDINSKRIA